MRANIVAWASIGRSTVRSKGVRRGLLAGFIAVVAVAVLTALPPSASPAARIRSAASSTAGHQLIAMACPATSQCTAIGPFGEVTFNPQSPGSPKPARVDTGLFALACASTTQCTALDEASREVTFNPRSPGAPSPLRLDFGDYLLANGGSLSCPSTAQCTVVGGSYRRGGAELTFDPRAPEASRPVLIEPDPNFPARRLMTVACPSVNQCTALDDGGRELTFVPQSPQNLTAIAVGASSDALACASTTQCTTVNSAEFSTFNPQLPDVSPVVGSTGVDLDGQVTMAGAACPAVIQCTGVFANDQEATFNPESLQPAARSRVFPPGYPQSSPWSVACAAVTECTAGNFFGREVTFNPQSSSRPTPVDLFANHGGGRGERIELYAPAQQSARICGANQRNRHVCHTFNMLGAGPDFRLAGWWWKGTVSIRNFAGLGGRGGLLDTTSCRIPATPRAAGFAHCDGFDYTWLYGDLVNHPRFLRFAVPHIGARWGVIAIGFFISSAHIGPAGVGYGDDRGFAASGVPPPAGSRVALALDFTHGIGVLRIDASCGVGPFGCGGPLPIDGGVYGVEPPGFGHGSHDPLTARNIFTSLSRGPAFLFTLAAGNGAFAGVGAWMLGEIDAGGAIKAEPGGNVKMTLSLKDFPSTEAYQIVRGHVRTLVRKREAGWKASQPIDTSPDDSSLKTLHFRHYTVCTSAAACA